MAEANASTAADSAAAQTAASQGSGQADVGSSTRTSGTETVTDVAQAEAMILQMKRLIAAELDFDKIANSLTQRMASAAVSHDNQLNNIAMQAVQNAVSLSQRVANLAVDHDARLRLLAERGLTDDGNSARIATDRMWNVDEVAGLVVKNPVFQDAIAGAVAAGVAAGVGKTPAA